MDISRRILALARHLLQCCSAGIGSNSDGSELARRQSLSMDQQYHNNNMLLHSLLKCLQLLDTSITALVDKNNTNKSSSSSSGKSELSCSTKNNVINIDNKVAGNLNSKFASVAGANQKEPFNAAMKTNGNLGNKDGSAGADSGAGVGSDGTKNVSMLRARRDARSSAAIRIPGISCAAKDAAWNNFNTCNAPARMETSHDLQQQQHTTHESDRKQVLYEYLDFLAVLLAYCSTQQSAVHFVQLVEDEKVEAIPATAPMIQASVPVLMHSNFGNVLQLVTSQCLQMITCVVDCSMININTSKDTNTDVHSNTNVSNNNIKNCASIVASTCGLLRAPERTTRDTVAMKCHAVHLLDCLLSRSRYVRALVCIVCVFLYMCGV